jgi:ubiquinone/menaquinone biosynthesis C-methylase UbiE
MKINHSISKSSLTAALQFTCLVILLTHTDPLRADTRDEESEFKQVAALLHLSSGNRVADVGAGGGGWTFRLAKVVGTEGHVYSTEVKPELVSAIRSGVRARGLKNVTVIQGDQDHMGLPADSCDAVLLRLVYHAFKNPAPMRDNLRTAVKTGGLVLIIDFRPSTEQLIREMKEIGYTDVQRIEKWQGQDSVYAVVFKKQI